MGDNRTMAKMLRAPTEGCKEAIVVPLILAEQFELKHSLINMMTSEQFFGHEKEIRMIKFVNQDSLNAAAGGNLLEKSPQDALTIIENKSKVCNSRSKPIASPVNACDINSNSEIAKLTHAVNQQMSAVTTAMTAMLKQLQATLPPAPVKAIKEIYVTCGGAHPYYQCLAAGGNTFLECRDNIQGYVSASTSNYNQGNPGYRPQGIRIDMVKNKLRNEMKTSIQTSLSNQTNEIKNMMASLLQMNTPSTSGSGSLPSNTVANPKGELKAITTRSGFVTNGPTVPTPPKSITPKVGERVKETYTDPDLAEYTIKQEKDEVQIQKFWHMFKQLYLNITLAEALVLMPNELKCKALADLGASINLMPLSVWKELGLPNLILTRMTLELANHAICTPDEIARDVFVSVGKFTFPADFVVVDYESDPRVPLILGRPFLRNARALIDVHGEEMILCDGDERLTLNMKHDTTSYSNHPHRESVNLINIFNVSSEDCFEFDIESNLKEIEFLLYQGKDSNLKDSIDQTDLANLDDYFVDPTPEMFTNEHAPDYSSPSRFDVYKDDFLEVESDADNDFSRDDDFPSPNNEDKEKKLAISCASLVLEDFDPPFCESLVSKDIPKSKMLLLFSSENEEKVFKPGIYTSKKVHSCFLPGLSHPGYHVFKVN
nr:reverse transcriptase domain-containing protein [Tanacetum cinerariifolium]